MEPIDFNEYKKRYFEEKRAKQERRRKRFFNLILPILSGALVLGVVTSSIVLGVSNYQTEQRLFTHGYQIEDCTHEVLEDGNTLVTVTFKNGVDPLTFTIDKGSLGKDGNYVTAVDSSVSEDDIITFVIHYSDHDYADTTISFPLEQGKEGRYVMDVRVSYDSSMPNVPTTIVFVYSDGTESEPITLPNGFTSEFGVSITGVRIGVVDEGRLPIAFIFTNESREDFTFYVLKGEDGKDGTTLSRVESRQDDSYYYVDFYFLRDDGNEYLAYTFRNDYVDDSTSWYQGAGEPNPSLLTSAKEGDLYFDTVNDRIYCLENGTWNLIFDVTGGEGGFSHPDYCIVTYDLNGGVWEKLGIATTMMSSVKYNDYAPTSFSDLGNPYLADKTFMGWYSYSDFGNPNAGKLDSLTPIVGDITVYAWYE